MIPQYQNNATIRVLLIADTHLGFDLPFRPRIERRRRGHDFFANLERALRPALKKDVDLVIHGGDLFFRTRVHPALVQMALAPFAEVAAGGVPVYIVPGNHERSRIPLQLWAAQPNIHIFDIPKTFLQVVRGSTIAISGFPFCRDVRDQFKTLLRETSYQQTDADIRILCLHQAVEGSQVGPSNYTFRKGKDVLPGVNIPGDFPAILCGHIHRSQMLTHDLKGRPLGAPVIYPGSIERTSFTERYEEKHYVILELINSNHPGGQLGEVSFLPLPARPMVMLDVEVNNFTKGELARHLETEFTALHPDSIVKIRIKGAPPGEMKSLSSAQLRALAPPSMNVSLAWNRRAG